MDVTEIIGQKLNKSHLSIVSCKPGFIDLYLSFYLSASEVLSHFLPHFSTRV